MDSKTIKPIKITADRTKRELQISWADGVQSRYPFDGLRAACPCVMCKGGHANMGGPPNPCLVRDAPTTDLGLEGVFAVGSYALQLNWSDGHNTGIYTWQLLRQADPNNCQN